MDYRLTKTVITCYQKAIKSGGTLYIVIYFICQETGTEEAVLFNEGLSTKKLNHKNT